MTDRHALLRFLVAGIVLVAAGLAVSATLDSLLTQATLTAYEFFGGDAARLHPHREDTVVTPIDGKLPEERLGWRDAGGFYVVFALALAAMAFPLNRWYALKMLDALVLAAFVWPILLALFLALVCTKNFLQPVLAPNSFVLPALAASLVFCLTTRLRETWWLATAAFLVLGIMITLMKHDPPLVAMLILLPLVCRPAEKAPAATEMTPSETVEP